MGRNYLQTGEGREERRKGKGRKAKTRSKEGNLREERKREGKGREGKGREGRPFSLDRKEFEDVHDSVIMFLGE